MKNITDQFIEIKRFFTQLLVRSLVERVGTRIDFKLIFWSLIDLLLVVFTSYLSRKTSKTIFLFSFNREHFDGSPKPSDKRSSLMSRVQQAIDSSIPLSIAVVGNAVQPIVGQSSESCVRGIVMAAFKGGTGSMRHLRRIC